MYNLPAAALPLIGREKELAQLQQMFTAPGRRLVTVVGLGGMGKTLLALEAARRAGERLSYQFRNGVAFVPLAGVSDPALLPAAIAQVLQLSLSGAHPPAVQLQNYLRNKRLLLLLDNFEQLLHGTAGEDGATLLVTLLENCPHLHLLVTSREPLHLAAEWQLRLEGLAYPQNGREQTADFPAVQLFVRAAQQMRRDYRLTKPDAPHVRELCRLTAGMPLAIQLAATWIRVMPVAQMAAEVARNLDLLAAEMRDLPPRQRSMRAVFEQTWALLPAAEQRLFAALAPFRGGFTAGAATTIAGATPFLLAGLVQRGLLQRDRSGRPRYEMHELVRQFAAEKLAEGGPGDVERAFIGYFARFLQAQAAEVHSSRFREVIEAITAELDNVRAAWGMLLEVVRSGRENEFATQQLETMMPALHLYYYWRGPLQEGLQLLGMAEEAMTAGGWEQESGDTPSPLRLLLARARAYKAIFQLGLSHYEAVDQVLAQELPVLRAGGATEGVAIALLFWGKAYLLRGERATAEEMFRECLPLFRQLGDLQKVADTLKVLGVVHVDRGDYAQAIEFDEQGLAVYRQLGFAPGQAQLLGNLGTVYFRMGEYERSRPYYEEALANAESANFARNVMSSNSQLSGVHRVLGNYERAAEFGRRAADMAHDLGEVRWESAALNGLSRVYLEQGELARARETLHEAVALAHTTANAPDLLAGLATAGELWAQQGQMAEALRVMLFVDGQRIAREKDRQRNATLLQELLSELPPPLVAEAREWVEAQSLSQVAEWVVGRLGD